MQCLRENVIFDLACPQCGCYIAPMNEALWGLVWKMRCDSCRKDIAVYHVLAANEAVVKKFLVKTYHPLKNSTVYHVDEIYRQLLDGSNREL